MSDSEESGEESEEESEEITNDKDYDTKIAGRTNTHDTHSNSNFGNETSSLEEKVLPASFICHALIGKGSFGEVYLVEKINSKTLYAMKVLSKDRIMGKLLLISNTNRLKSGKICNDRKKCIIIY